MQALTHRLSNECVFCHGLVKIPKLKLEVCRHVREGLAELLVARIHLALTKVDLAGADTLDLMGANMCFLHSFHVKFSAKNQMMFRAHFPNWTGS